jgi:hypothetical protein
MKSKTDLWAGIFKEILPFLAREVKTEEENEKPLQ